VEKPIWQIPAYKRRNRSKEKSPISGTATTVASPGQSREKTDLTTKEKSNNVQQALPFLSSDKVGAFAFCMLMKFNSVWLRNEDVQWASGEQL